MPRSKEETPSTNETITRPVALHLARQVLQILGLSPETKILYPGESGQALQRGTTAEDGTQNPVSFKYDDQWQMEVTERPHRDYVLATHVHQNEAHPYFHDPKLGVILRPVYSHTTMEFTIVLRSSSRDRAKRIRDQILASRSQGREEHLHEIQYAYCVPLVYLFLLKEIHALREATAGYGEDYSKWVRDHISGRATNLTNLVGSQSVLAIQEHQSEVMGWFDFDASPDTLEKDQDAGTWNWSLTYTVNFDKVISTAAQWPLVVHNQIIPEPWATASFNQAKLTDPARRPARAQKWQEAIRSITGGHLRPNYCAQRMIDGVIFPAFDDWEPQQVQPHTSTMITSMVQVAVDSPREVTDLDDGFIDFTIDEDVLEFMRGEAPYLNRYMQSIIHISLYEDGEYFRDGMLLISPALTIDTTIDMDPRRNYHLRISIVNNLMGLTYAARERLLRGGKGAQKILMALQWKTLPEGAGATIPPIGNDGRISDDYFDQVAIDINHAKGIHYTGIEYRLLNVGQYLIHLHRRSDAVVSSGASNADHATNPASPGTGDGASGDGERHPVPGCDSGYPLPK